MSLRRKFKQIIIVYMDFRLHRFLTKIYNWVLSPIPHIVKYGIGVFYRKRFFPYKVLEQGDTVLIIGSARDLLEAGRSRSITASMIVGGQGKVIVIEADRDSYLALKNYIQKHDLKNILLTNQGAWKEKGTLSFIKYPTHPAAGRIDGVVKNRDLNHEASVKITIDVDTIDNILDHLGIHEEIKLTSITVNGAEHEVLEGMNNSISRCQHFSIARASNDVLEFMESKGYQVVGRDDRGLTFSH